MFFFSNRLTTIKIYIANISDGTTKESLRALFEQYGRVAEAVVFRYYGFVVSIAI